MRSEEDLTIDQSTKLGKNNIRNNKTDPPLGNNGWVQQNRITESPPNDQGRLAEFCRKITRIIHGNECRLLDGSPLRVLIGKILMQALLLAHLRGFVSQRPLTPIHPGVEEPGERRSGFGKEVKSKKT